MCTHHFNITHHLTLACLLISLVGCGDAPAMSPQSYEIATALYTACRKADSKKLVRIKELTDTALEKGEISEKEADMLTSIVAMAEAEGEWKEAARLARELMESQVRGR